MWRTFVAVVFLGAIATVGVIVFELVMSSPGAAACDNLDDLGAERTVKRLERYVSSRVVQMKVTDGYERVEVTGCSQSMSALSNAMSHKQFSKIADCLAAAKTESAASRCL